MHANHYRVECSCGEVISQCRCSSPDKTVSVVQNGCRKCHPRPSPAQIKAYAAEIDAGIAELVVASNSVAMASLAKPSSGFEINDQAREAIEKAVGHNLNQVDLYYLNSILVSTGCNLNDDYFEKSETWEARATPEDKPFNYEHKTDDIIGHITACVPVDAEGKAITEPADSYHILTSAVVYKRCQDPERQKRADAIVEEIPQGKWYVSMECLFTDFDYIMFPKDETGASYDFAKGTLVERNERTAFLTKHLRCYGGSGTFNNQKICRVLRNIVFCGKGLVRNPANPNSVIYCVDDKPNKGVVAKVDDQINEQVYENREQVIATSTDSKGNQNMNDSEKIVELEKKLADALAQLRDKDVKGFENQIASLTEQVASLQKQLADTKAEADKMAGGAKDALAQVDEYKKQVEGEKARADELQTRLDEIENETRAANRLAAVKAAYEIEDDAEAQEVLDGIAELSDEAFAKHIETQKKVIAGVKSKVKPGKSEVSNLQKPNQGSKPVKASKKDLDGAEASDDLTGAVDGEGESEAVANLRKDVNTYFTKEQPSKNK